MNYPREKDTASSGVDPMFLFVIDITCFSIFFSKTRFIYLLCFFRSRRNHIRLVLYVCFSKEQKTLWVKQSIVTIPNIFHRFLFKAYVMMCQLFMYSLFLGNWKPNKSAVIFFIEILFYLFNSWSWVAALLLHITIFSIFFDFIRPNFQDLDILEQVVSTA